MNTWKLSIEFLEAASFHVGSGYGYAGRVDRSLRLDHIGMPFVPGSALKGKLRHAAQEIATSIDATACLKFCPPGSSRCSICSLFGSPFNAGKVIVSDARCIEGHLRDFESFASPKRPTFWLERQSTAIDRRTRTALTGRLFSIEAAPSGLKLVSHISGDLAPPEKQLLNAAVRTIAWLGGGSSRGLGGCRCKLE